MDTRLHERSDVPCRGCGSRLYEVGSWLVCGTELCSRWAEPVDAKGRTPEEAHADAIAPLFPGDGAESADEMAPSCRACNDTRTVPDNMLGEVTCGDCYSGDGTEMQGDGSYSSEKMDNARGLK